MCQKFFFGAGILCSSEHFARFHSEGKRLIIMFKDLGIQAKTKQGCQYIKLIEKTVVPSIAHYTDTFCNAV